ncbi:hypothetical protein Tco_1146706 [Tanacetum coccineum]
MASPYPDTTDEAMVEAAALIGASSAHGPIIDEFYPSTEAARQDKDATLDALELAHGWISDAESRLEESEAMEADLERCMRSLEE